MTIFRSIFTLTFLLLVTAAFAQADLEALRAKYPKEDVVYLYQKEHLTISIEGKGLKIENNISESMAFLTGEDLRFSKESIYYNSFSEIRDIKAYTMVPAKRKHQEVPVSNFEEKDAISGGVFYDDHKKLQFVFPQVQKDAYTHLSYTEEIKDPRMLGSFFFNSYIPVLEATYQITAPKTVELAFEMMGEHTDQVTFTKKESGDNVIYTWTAGNIPKLTFESNAPSRSYYDPHLVVRITSYEIGNRKQHVLRNVDDLYAWYSSLVAQTNNDISPEIKTLVSQLIQNAKTDREKAQAIFQWVQQNITYVAFEDGMGGFIPRSAASVCSKKYGDCKDMANLLKVMLTEAGLNAHRTWIGTRNRPYAYEKVPTPIVDNHMIAALELDGETLFLDATGQYTPFGLPTSMIQGKEALVEQGPESYKIMRVPVVPAEKSVKADTTKLTINNGNVLGSGRTHWTGYLKVNMEYHYYGEDDQNLETFMSKALQRGSNKFNLKQVTVDGLKDPGADLLADFDFVIPDYAKEVAGKIYINLNLEKNWADMTIDINSRRYDREFEQKHQLLYIIELEIPEGYRVDYLPGAAQVNNHKFGSFYFTYQQQGNTIILNKKLVLDTLMLHKADMADWNTFIDKLNKAYKETVVLVREK